MCRSCLNVQITNYAATLNQISIGPFSDQGCIGTMQLLARAADTRSGTNKLINPMKQKKKPVTNFVVKENISFYTSLCWCMLAFQLYSIHILECIIRLS